MFVQKFSAVKSMVFIFQGLIYAEKVSVDITGEICMFTWCKQQG